MLLFELGFFSLIPKLSYVFFVFVFLSIFISRRNRLGGGTRPTACILMTMPTATRRVLARNVRIARATAVSPRTCVRLRTWLKCLTAVPRPTGLRGKKGWWDYRLCWRTSVLSGTTQIHTPIPRGSFGVFLLLSCSSKTLFSFYQMWVWSYSYAKDELDEQAKCHSNLCMLITWGFLLEKSLLLLHFQWRNLVTRTEVTCCVFVCMSSSFEFN